MGEDKDLSVVTNVELKKLFPKKKVQELVMERKRSSLYQTKACNFVSSDKQSSGDEFIGQSREE